MGLLMDGMKIYGLMREDWHIAKLKQIGKWTGGGTPKKSNPDFWNDGTIAWVSPKDMKSKYVDDTVDKITELAVENSSAKMINEGSILFVTRSGILRRTLPVGLIRKKVTVNQDIKALTVRGMVPEYIYWYAVGNDHEIRKECAKDGTTVESIDTQKLHNYSIPLPPLPEQRAIVAKLERLFSELDHGIGSLRTARAQLGVYRQAVLRAAFAGEWKRLPLKELADITGGVTKGRKLEGKTTIELSYLRVANVQDGFLKLDVIKKIKVLPKDLEKYRLEYEDVLFTEGGDRDKLGRGTVWKNEIPDCIHQNHIFRARVKNKSILSPYFLSYYAQSPEGKQYFFDKGKHTTNLASINKTVLSNLPVPLPNPEKQKYLLQEIESQISICDHLEQTIGQALDQAAALRQSLLKKAFAGELLTEAELAACRAEPDWVPAGELLERIKGQPKTRSHGG